MAITLEDFLASPQLGGACGPFHDRTPWRSWLAFERSTLPDVAYTSPWKGTSGPICDRKIAFELRFSASGRR